MHKLYELKENLMKELEDYSENKKYSKDDVESIKYMASAVDHLCNIMEGAEEGYSGRGYSNTPYMDTGYSNAYSRARGRMNARRDSMGRYSRGYSMANDAILTELREMMQDAPNERVRKNIQSVITDMESM